MNQDDFKKLLATPRASTAAQTPRTKFGAPPPKRGATVAALSETTKEDFKKPDFKPRSSKFKKGKKDGEGEDADGAGAYRDRAAERRTGKESDFAGVEKLLEDFKARAAQTEDKHSIEEQMKYLGGDAEHSVLVKGLDMALLERMKNSQSLQSDQSIEQVEEELDRALAVEGGRKKRSRDEMVLELRAKRGAVEEVGIGGVGEVKETVEKEKEVMSRFKPIGKPKEDKKKLKGKEKEGAASTTEKRRRKKIKPSATPLSTATSTPSTLPAAVQPLPVVDDDDEDDDIFSGVPSYKGIDTDSDSDSESKPSSSSTLPPPTASSIRKPAAYFDDEADEESITTAPSSVTNLTKTQSRPSEEEGEEQEEDGRPMRLKPLSGSAIPSVRALLEMDKEAEKEELRKAKKLKFNPKAAVDGEKPEKNKNRTEEDKSNSDYLEMMNHLEKREKRKNMDQGEEEIGPGS